MLTRKTVALALEENKEEEKGKIQICLSNTKYKHKSCWLAKLKVENPDISWFGKYKSPKPDGSWQKGEDAKLIMQIQIQIQIQNGGQW